MPEANSFIRPEVLLSTIGLRAQQTFVHLGCGAGFYLIPAARIVGSKGKSIGVDLLPDMIAEADNKARHQGLAGVVQTFRANIENPGGSGLPAKSADIVLVANILHQSDPSKVLLEAARIVSAIGSVVIVEWNTAATPFGPPAQHRRTAEEMKTIAASSGLTLTKEFAPSPYHYGLVFALKK